MPVELASSIAATPAESRSPTALRYGQGERYQLRQVQPNGYEGQFNVLLGRVDCQPASERHNSWRKFAVLADYLNRGSQVF